MGALRRDGSDRGHTLVPGELPDVALDRFGTLWFTNRPRAALGAWDRRRLTEVAVPTAQVRSWTSRARGRGQLELWFLDSRGRVGLIDPTGGGVRTFKVKGGPPSRGPSRLTAGFAGATWYTTETGLSQVSAQGGSRIFNKSLRATRRAYRRPDGSLWVAARRGPWLVPGLAERASPLHTGPAASARLHDIARDTPRGDLWLACARPPALLRFTIPELARSSADARGAAVS